jgi:hypothetical protein
LVALDLATFEQSLQHMGGVDPATRAAILERADKAFREVDGK